MKIRYNSSTLASLFAVAALCALSACGGSSGGSGTKTVTGSVFASYVGGAKVVVKNTDGDIIAGPVTTDTDGSFSVNVPAGSDLVFESYSGTFDDEATPDTGVEAGHMGAYVPAGTPAVHITPATTIIHGLVMVHGKTFANATSLFKGAFGYLPDLTIAPTDATAPAVGSTAAQKLAGLRAAAFSQLAKDLGLTPQEQFDLFAALARDLSNGTLNGVATSGIVSAAGTPLPEDVGNMFGQALLNFMDSENDATGLQATDIGTLPFAKVALTSNYRVEYIPGMMAAAAGKTKFRLKITSADGLTPITGLSGMNLMLMPMMHMASHMHTTPVESCAEIGGGEYECTVYYLMPTEMSGLSSGYWELKVKIMNSELAYFYPYVGMNMNLGNANFRRAFKSYSAAASADKIEGMTGDEKRTYYIFNNGFSGTTGSYTLEMFIAATEAMSYMKYPPITGGTQLHDQNGAAWTVDANTTTVEVSTDGNTWVAATNSTSGNWTATGLDDPADSKVYVRLTVNGIQKTADGNSPDGVSDPATTNKNTYFPLYLDDEGGFSCH